MIGDNRDNSVDSRAPWGVGYVPFENLIGRAALLYSTSPDRSGTTTARTQLGDCISSPCDPSR